MFREDHSPLNLFIVVLGSKFSSEHECKNGILPVNRFKRIPLLLACLSQNSCLLQFFLMCLNVPCIHYPLMSFLFFIMVKLEKFCCKKFLCNFHGLIWSWKRRVTSDLHDLHDLPSWCLVWNPVDKTTSSGWGQKGLLVRACQCCRQCLNYQFTFPSAKFFSNVQSYVDEENALKPQLFFLSRKAMG